VEVPRRLDAYPTELDDDGLLDVHNRFHSIVTDPKSTINAKAKMLLKEVRIFTHPNGHVTLQCVGGRTLWSHHCSPARSREATRFRRATTSSPLRRLSGRR
jgi:hypothetical protein